MNTMAIYERLPVFLQNAVVAHYGRKLHRMRFGGAHAEQAAEILRCETMDRAAMEAYQVTKLKAVLREAADHLPFYRESAGELRELAAGMSHPSD
ncbi:MAG: hypothetical protein GF346_05705, partial [Candidatus Eisenbacteria bacterium]|nr:hypothetical protein [Candidatus Latescibacterota bacterium]MBD3301923.1 hypothetical protein [Candidatus Eisenbacteria bacterium]